MSFQVSSALLDVVLCESLGDTGSDGALSDSMYTFEAVRPPMFADITVSTVERLWLFTEDIVWFDVLEDFVDYLTLSSNLAGIATTTLLP